MISLGDALLKLGVDKSEFDKSMKETQENVKTSMEKIQTSLKVAGAAFTALGVAGLKMVSDARKMNAELGQTALTLGVTSKEMRDLALSTTDVTFPLKSVADTFDLLSRAGVKDLAVMQKNAKAFDALADATGSSAEVVADILVPAFKVFKLELPKTSKELDKFTWLTKNTTISLADFGSVMDYVAMYGANLNVTVEDMIGIMAALEAKGMTGASATRLFRTAVNQAATGTVTLSEALDLTQEEIDGYKDKLGAATGITDEYAAVANTQFSIMDKLKQLWSELSLRVGSFLKPLESVLTLMTTLGPVFLFLSTSIGMSTVKWIAHTVALVAHRIAALASAAANYVLNASLGIVGWAIIAVSVALAVIIPLIMKAVGGTNDLTTAMSKLEKQTLRMNIQQSYTADKWADIISKGYLTREEFEKLAKALGTTTKSLREQLQAAGMLEASITSLGETRIFLKNLEETKIGLEKVAKVSAKTKDEMINDLKVLSSEAKRRATETTQNEINEIDKRMRAVTKDFNERMSKLDKEYDSVLRNIDAQLGIVLSGYQAQIDAINAMTDAENLALERGAEQQRLIELQAAVDSAKTDEEKATAIKELNEYQTEINRMELLRQRDNTIKALRTEMDAARTAAQNEKDLAETEYQENKRILEQEQEDLLAKLEDDKTALDAALNEQLNRYDEDLAKFDDTLALKLLHLDEFIAEYNAALKALGVTPAPTIPGGETGGVEIPGTSPSAVTPNWGEILPGLLPEYLGYVPPGMAGGGIIPEPTLLYGMKSMKPYAIAGEAGPERVVPGGGLGREPVVIELNSIINLDGEKIGNIAGRRIVDLVRLRGGLTI